MDLKNPNCNATWFPWLLFFGQVSVLPLRILLGFYGYDMKTFPSSKEEKKKKAEAAGVSHFCFFSTFSLSFLVTL